MRNLLIATLFAVFALSACGGLDDGQPPDSEAETGVSEAALFNNGGSTSGPSCSARNSNGTLACSITCSKDQIAVCSDGLTCAPGVNCSGLTAGTCSCKGRSRSFGGAVMY